MVMGRLRVRMERHRGLKRKLRGLRRGNPPEAWGALYESAQGEELREDLLRAMGVVAAHYDHAPGLHPASLLRRKGEGGERRFYRLLRASTALALAEELARMSAYLGGALDYEEVERSLRSWGEREKLRWLKRFVDEEVVV